MQKISVIVPVYNTEKYLEKCINSITSQTYRNLEIICIDDGSIDNSSDLLECLARKDNRIKVIHKENEGLVAARKTGVNVAAGELIAYVDSDDWIEPDMYEKLYQIMQDYKVDLVTSGYYLEGNYTTKHLDMVEEGIYKDNQILELRENTIYCLSKKETGLRGSLWCKLFKKSLLKQAQNKVPNTVSIAEDKLCLINYLLECKSAYVLKEAFYHWVIRQQSMSHEKNNGYLLKINEVYSYMIKLYSHPNFTESMCTQAEIYIMELLFLGINKRMGFKNKNMIWIDPMWMDDIPVNARVILYGAGELGEKYAKQLNSSRKDVKIIACVDEKYKKLSKEKFEVVPVEKLQKYNFDYVVITIKNKDMAMQIKNRLLDSGISKNKILWKEQPEAYWRFLDAEGIIDKNW